MGKILALNELRFLTSNNDVETSHETLRAQLGIAKYALANIVEDGGYSESEEAAKTLIKIAELLTE